MRNKMLTILCCSLTGLLPLAAHADGLSDLKTFLSRMQGQTAMHATIDVKTWRRLGEGADASDRIGNANARLDDSNNGLQLIYSRELMDRIEQEERARAKDPNSKSPTLAALPEFEAGQLRIMTNAARHVSQSLEKAIFKGEKADTYNGKPARLLSFEIAQSSLSERERKYIKKFEGGMQIWVAADGAPLASRTTTAAYGRAFIVISFEAKSEEQQVYAVAGDRLVMTQKESKNSASGAGEHSDERVVKTLSLQ